MAHHGVSAAPLRKCPIATGRITTLPDGAIDLTRANSEWGARTDLVTQHSQHAREMRADKDAATKPVPQAEILVVTNTCAMPTPHPARLPRLLRLLRLPRLLRLKAKTIETQDDWYDSDPTEGRSMRSQLSV